MKNLSRMVIVAVVAMTSALAMAQVGPIEVKKLTDQLFLLSTNQGSYTTNTIAFVGNDGVLLVDAQAESDAEELKKAVDAFEKGTPRYIINTHRHVEHVGGNSIFGDEPIVIAHDLVPAKLRSGSYIFNEFPDATFPDITLTTSLTLYFNDEQIHIHALPGSHDDNEIIVHFTRSKVVHLSSLVNGFNFPSVDSDGDVLKFAELVSRAIELLPDDVVIVSGHNDVGTWNDLHAYREMLLQTTEVIQNGLAEGKDLATLQKEKVLDNWAKYAGSYVSLDDWIEYLVDGLQEKKAPPKNIFEPLYGVWKDKGAEAALEYYFELKRNHSDEYRFTDSTLLVIGNKLLGNNRAHAAAKFLEASLKENPDSKYGYYTSYKLAETYQKMNDRELAVEYCEKALELNPEFEAAAELLAELKKK
jgi:glyoxylase-like metal-dependent hydrolase (beta-lactamase superfamily II)